MNSCTVDMCGEQVNFTHEDYELRSATPPKNVRELRRGHRETLASVSSCAQHRKEKKSRVKAEDPGSWMLSGVCLCRPLLTHTL